MAAAYRREAWLVEHYHEKGWTQREMADACDVFPRTIREWMDRHAVETRDMEGENHPLYGKERDESVKAAIAETMSGREVTDETRRKIADANRGRSLGDETRRKISETLRGRTKSRETRRRMSDSAAGDGNANWRGGYGARYGGGWAIARRSALERDGECQHCGHDGSDRRLEVHHIIPVREFRESSTADVSEAQDLENLVVLCRRCHPKADHGKLGVESGIDPP